MSRLYCTPGSLLVWYLTRCCWASHCIAANSEYFQVVAVSTARMLWAKGRA